MNEWFLNFSTYIKNIFSRKKIWRHSYHDFVALYYKPWSLISPYKGKEQTLFSVIDKSDGKSYIVKIAVDANHKTLSNESFYEMTELKILSSHRDNELLEESDIIFHNERFHQQVFLLHTQQWGLLKCYTNTRRTGRLMYSIQISFPVTLENARGANIPVSLMELDKGITF